VRSRATSKEVKHVSEPADAGRLVGAAMSGDEIPTTDELVGGALALLDELARRLDPDMAAAVLREHGFSVASVDELQRRLDGFRT
jgi:hypothetical protein